MFPLGSFQFSSPIPYALGTGGDPIPLTIKILLVHNVWSYILYLFLPLQNLIIVVPQKIVFQKKNSSVQWSTKCH